MKYHSYVLRSLKNGLLYKGSTSNIENRIKDHNAGRVTFSSKHTPWEIVILELHDSMRNAMKREKWYKTGVGREWIKKQMSP